MARPAEQVLAEVEDVSAAISHGEEALAGFYARRVALFREARALDPPVQHRLLAHAAGISEVVVQAVIRKAVKAEREAAAAMANAGAS